MTPYSTTDDGDDYWEGTAAWENASDEAKEAAIFRAHLWLDGTYGARFSGVPVGDDQWPRVGATDAYGRAIPPDEIPERVKYAELEAALAELVTPSSLLPSYDLAEAQVIREKVGPLEVQYSDLKRSSSRSLPGLTVVDFLLWQYFTHGLVPVHLTV